MGKSIEKQVVELLQKALKKLNLKEDTPRDIGECTKKKQLEKFSVAQLSDWLKENEISLKKIKKKNKKNIIEIVWENIEIARDSSSRTDDDSESDSGSSSDSV
jgi:hypothetical protein